MKFRCFCRGNATSDCQGNRRMDISMTVKASKAEKEEQPQRSMLGEQRAWHRNFELPKKNIDNGRTKAGAVRASNSETETEPDSGPLNLFRPLSGLFRGLFRALQVAVAAATWLMKMLLNCDSLRLLTDLRQCHPPAECPGIPVYPASLPSSWVEPSNWMGGPSQRHSSAFLFSS